MMDLSKLHEEEIVELRSRNKRRVSELRRALRSLNFVLHDDIWSLDRTDHIPPWQHGSIVELDVIQNESEVFEADDWDTLRCRYLFSSLPQQFVNPFIDVVTELAERLSLQLFLNDQPAGYDTLLAHFERCSLDLQQTFCEDAGSESLAILIQSTYPRR